MKKTFILFITTTYLLWSATIEQVEHYLSVSSSEEEILLLESQFSAMQNSFSTDMNDDRSTYDMQLLTVRFKESIQRSLSENEMDEILETYKNVLFLQFVSTATYAPDKNETNAYLFRLQEDETLQERLALLESISKALNNKDSMLVLFDELMKPLLQRANGGSDIDEKIMEKRRESYMKSRIAEARKDTLYNLRDFTLEELEELLTIVKSTSVQHETRAVRKATAYALKEFFLSIASRYDISKHDPSKYNKSTKDNNHTK